MKRTMNGWIDKYKEMGALWIHSGNPKQPHALLTSGNHSDGFFNSGLVTADPLVLNEATMNLAEKLLDAGMLKFIFSKIHWVVGPAMGAITLAHDLARHFGCLTAFTEKADGEGVKTMVLKRATLKPGECVLPAEDVLTTGGSVELTAKAIVDAGGQVFPFVAVLVNRSGLTEVGGKKIVALIDRPMPMWTPDECPLCKAGSEAIRAKGSENWARLKATY